MNTARATNATPAPSAEVLSFAEISCFNQHDQLRSTLSTVAFRLFSVGRGLGRKLDLQFYSDYGVYYSGDDDELIATLQQVSPEVNWGAMVFHRWLDQSRIQIINPERGNIVAQIETRRYYGRKICEKRASGGEYGPNIISLSAVRHQLEMLAVAGENDQ